MNDSLLSGFLDGTGFGNFPINNTTNHNSSFLDGGSTSNDLFAIFDSFHRATTPVAAAAFPPPTTTTAQKSTFSTQDNSKGRLLEKEVEVPRSKRQKTTAAVVVSDDQEELADGGGDDGRISHITVERNRRKQMNGHLAVLRSLMPCFYVKRGDQASIIGGVVDYIKELQQVLQSLQAKKQRKSYTEVLLSPRLIPTTSPRPINLPPISPRTPQTPNSPYKPKTTSLLQQQQHHQMFPVATNNSNLLHNYYNSSSVEPSPTTSSSSSSNNNIVLNDGDNGTNELVAKSRSSVADVEVKFSGANLVLKTVSSRIPGQVVKIISALEEMCFEILHVGINVVDDTMHNSFTIKIGIECQLSAEELAQQIQQTFC
ncbi:Transcription factor SPEECHLESS [Linum perenne]